MLSRVLILCGCLLVLTGCASKYEAMPQIIFPSGHESAAYSPEVVRRPLNHQAVNENVPADWLPPSSVEKNWTAIVIHHSATEKGNAAIFDRIHREHNHWEGVGYDFVIGNGTDSGDGEVEVTFRWRRQIPGAHCGGTPGNWANQDGIGICIVGNFDQTTPTARQMRALVKLVCFLQKKYKISESYIYGHNSAPGARVTNCPGAKFPMSTLKQMLRLRVAAEN
jgi:hypothetical protein